MKVRDQHSERSGSPISLVVAVGFVFFLLTEGLPGGVTGLKGFAIGAGVTFVVMVAVSALARKEPNARDRQTATFTLSGSERTAFPFKHVRCDFCDRRHR